MRILIFCGLVAALVCSGLGCLAGTSTQWLGSIAPDDLGGGFGFGVWPGYHDGYDGLPVSSSWSRDGVHMLLYRSNSPTWSGPTGFYGRDDESHMVGYLSVGIRLPPATR